MIKSYTKHEAIKIISAASKDYKENLVGKNFIIIYRDRHRNVFDYFETAFLPRNFQHLTGVDFIGSDGKILKQSVHFYKKCITHSLSEKEILYRNDGTTNLKLQALPKVVNFFKTSNMTTTLDTFQPQLQVDRLVGNITYCLGFTKDNKYYVPSSCLLKDIRDFSETQSQIITVLSKSNDKEAKYYKEIKYVAKKIDLKTIQFPENILKLIEL